MRKLHRLLVAALLWTLAAAAPSQASPIVWNLDAAAATLVGLAELAAEASGAAPRLAATLVRLGRGEDAARLLGKTRDAAGRSASPGARAAVVAIEAQLAGAASGD